MVATLQLIGHISVKVTLDSSGDYALPILTGGGLAAKQDHEYYELASLHWHWGDYDAEGAEHRLSGTPFAMEVGKESNYLHSSFL